MHIFERVFTKEQAVGHAERNRQSIEIMKKELPKLHLEFAVININKALDLISKKRI